MWKVRLKLLLRIICIESVNRLFPLRLIIVTKKLITMRSTKILRKFRDIYHKQQKNQANGCIDIFLIIMLSNPMLAYICIQFPSIFLQISLLLTTFTILLYFHIIHSIIDLISYFKCSNRLKKVRINHNRLKYELWVCSISI